MLQKLGSVLSFLSASIMLITVLSLPWMLGGVIPLARLVLLIGAITAVVLSVLANVLRRKFSESVPAVFIPVIALALLGTFQLRPAAESPAAHMDHAVHKVTLPTNIPDLAHTLIPADTRSTVATLLALALLSCVAFEQLRSGGSVMAASLLILANGIAIASVGMTHMLQEKQFALNQIWSLGSDKALVTVFATFVNPNNAAGWLCLCVAVAAGWITWHVNPSSTSPSLRRGRLRISLFGRLWQRAVEFLADLTVWQIITLTGAALLAAGVAATQSRGGIVALMAAVVLTAFCRSSLRSLPLVIVLLVAAGLTTFGVLQWLDLDAGVVSEMETLKDLDQAAGARPAHWMDSLHAVRDFPIFGTGLGSYRFATPAYSRHHTGVWFRNADNQYVDMIVEGGVIGLLLFIAIGVIGLTTGFAAWRQSKTKTTSRLTEAPRLSRRALAGMGTAIILGTLSQAVSAFLDYGVGLPAASSLLLLLIAGTSGFLVEGNVAAKLKEAGSVRVGRLVVTPLQLLLAVAAATQIPDQLAATKIDEVIVAGHRILNSPVQADELVGLAPTRAALENALAEREDDPEGLRMLTRLAEAEFRWAILQQGRGETLKDNPKFGRLWDNVNFQALITQLSQIERDEPTTAKRLRKQMLETLSDVKLAEVLERVQQRYPMMPRLSGERADIAVLTSDVELFDQQAAIAQFADPANAGTLFKIGSLALRRGRPELTKQVWQDSLTLTPEFRSLMLLDGRLQWSNAETLELFGPRDYVACVHAAQRCPDVGLRQQLWQNSEEFWTNIGATPDVESSRVRVAHLLAQSRKAEALTWLETSLKQHHGDLKLRRLYAQQLEQNGQFRSALREWNHILFLDAGDEEAAVAISRIRGLKSPDEQNTQAARKP